MTSVARIACLDAPYDPQVERALFGMQPRDSRREPLRLFRLCARNMPLCDRMFELGRFMLGRNSPEVASYDRGTRELVIGRVTARCRCEYEWGVHVAPTAKGSGFPQSRPTRSFMDRGRMPVGPMRIGPPWRSP